MDEESAPAISYEDLALLEEEFEQIDVEILRQQYELSKGAYAKRAEAIAKIPSFWPLVLEQSPPDVDQYITPNDSRILAEHLVNLEVTRPEIESSSTTTGSPRSFVIKFHFKPNDDFDDSVLAKTFWYRRARDGFAGLVSEPVKIHWKKGKDLTEGLTDGAVALWEARKKANDMTKIDLPEYAALKEKVEHWNGANTSFFTWFGWVSTRRWIGAEESAEANKAFAARQAARQRGEKVEVPEQDDDDEDGDANDDSDVEVHEAGEDLAISFSDDIWPNAIKFFTQAQELGDLSDVDFEDFDDDEEDDEEDDDGDEPVDIRALVGEMGKGRGKRQSDVGPPSKKQKK